VGGNVVEATTSSSVMAVMPVPMSPSSVSTSTMHSDSEVVLVPPEASTEIGKCRGVAATRVIFMNVCLQCWRAV